MNISLRGGGGKLKRVRFNCVRQTRLLVSLKQLVLFAEAVSGKGAGAGSETGHGAEEGQGSEVEDLYLLLMSLCGFSIINKS